MAASEIQLIQDVVLSYQVLAESIGDPKELVKEFATALEPLQAVEARIPPARKYLEDRLKNNIPGVDSESMKANDVAWDVYHAIIRANTRSMNCGHKLFLSILQQYDLPPPVRKKVEIASRVYMKRSKPRFKNLSGFAMALHRFEYFDKLYTTLKAHYALAKLALEKGKEHTESVPDSSPGSPVGTKFKVGQFTLINTGGFDDKRMAEVAEVVKKASAYAQSSGLGQVLYGNIQVTNTLHKSNVMAFYLISSDELFIRANVSASSGVVFTVLHELGHRFEKKFSNQRGVERLYQLLGNQEIKRKNDDIPKPGDTITSKGTTYVVKGLKRIPRGGYKVELYQQDAPQLLASISLDGWNSMKGQGNRQDVNTNPNYIGYVTDYAKRGGPSENFAEMFAFYCMGNLPVLQSAPFEELVFGSSKTAADRQLHKVVARSL